MDFPPSLFGGAGLLPSTPMFYQPKNSVLPEVKFLLGPAAKPMDVPCKAAATAADEFFSGSPMSCDSLGMAASSLASTPPFTPPASPFLAAHEPRPLAAFDLELPDGLFDDMAFLQAVDFADLTPDPSPAPSPAPVSLLPLLPPLLPALTVPRHKAPKKKPARAAQGPPTLVATAPPEAKGVQVAAEPITTTRSGRKTRNLAYDRTLGLGPGADVDTDGDEPDRPLAPAGRPGAPASGAARRRRAAAAGMLGGRRDSHNMNERVRRRDLKSSFDALRDQVPKVAGDSRVHTGTVLVEAIAYIHQLEQEDASLQAQVSEARVINQRLKMAGCFF